MHSPKFNKVKSYYDRGLWSKKQVADAVIKEWITAEEYAEITGAETNE
ncbi:MAG: XkdX family protein [Clostridia bacterium]|nr:XkdX family protein [Clostridia bacterium]